MQDFTKSYDSLAEAAQEILDENRYKDMSVDEVAYWRVKELIDSLSGMIKSKKRIPNRLSKDMSVDEKAYWHVVKLIDTLRDTLKKESKG